MARPAPSIIVVMGVSGAGKTTIGKLLAERLGWDFADGDQLHSAANVEKMSAGVPLTDEDRWPWLDEMAAWIDARRREKGHAVVAGSVLKRSYRAIVIGSRADVRLVFLDGPRELIARRQAARRDHFMPSGLLDSQFATLEPPGADEDAIRVSVEPLPHEIVNDIIDQIETQTGASALSDDRRRERQEENPE